MFKLYSWFLSPHSINCLKVPSFPHPTVHFARLLSRGRTRLLHRLQFGNFRFLGEGRWHYRWWGKMMAHDGPKKYHQLGRQAPHSADSKICLNTISKGKKPSVLTDDLLKNWSMLVYVPQTWEGLERKPALAFWLAVDWYWSGCKSKTGGEGGRSVNCYK